VSVAAMPTRPSAARREAFLEAAAMPFSRRIFAASSVEVLKERRGLELELQVANK